MKRRKRREADDEIAAQSRRLDKAMVALRATVEGNARECEETAATLARRKEADQVEATAARLLVLPVRTVGA